MIVAARQQASSSRSIVERIRRDFFPRSNFSDAGQGVTVADDQRRKLASAFQPIVRTRDGAIGGHHALLRGVDSDGRFLCANELFEGSGDEAADELDRLARALHAINYFAGKHERSRLFMTVDQRLLTHAPEDHRRYFDAVLSLLDVPTSRIAMALPRAALDDPVTFVRSAISWRIRGYRVLAQMRPEDAHADLEHVFMADPHYVAIDAATFPPADDERGRDRLRSVISSLDARGIQALARRVETGEQAQLAREAGFSLLQGWHVAPTTTALAA